GREWLVLGGSARAGAAVDGGKLYLKPLADRVSRRARRLAGLRRRRGGCTRRHLGKAVVGLGQAVAWERERCREQGAGEEPPGEGIGQRMQHIRPLNDFAGGPFGRSA